MRGSSINTQRGAVTPLMALLLIGGGAILGGIVAGAWVFMNVDARLLLTNQAAEVIIPEPFPASAKVLENLKIAIDDSISTTVPVDVQLSLPIKDTLNVLAEFDGEVPIKMDVRVKDTITIDQVLELDTVIDANFLGDWHKLPIRGKVPVKAQVPVDLTIPVNKNVRLKFTAPVKARIKDKVNVPLKTQIAATIPIKSTLEVPVLSDIKADVTLPPDQPVSIIVNYADLLLPLRSLALGLQSGDEPAPAQPAEVQQGTP